MNEFLDTSKSIREITKSASRALGAVYTKFWYAGGMTYDVYTELINSIVEPVLFYCAGIWGHRYYIEIDAVLNKACRYFLGTSKNASNLATRGDMGIDSCIVKQKLEPHTSLHSYRDELVLKFEPCRGKTCLWSF